MGNKKKLSIVIIAVIVISIAAIALKFTGVFGPNYLNSNSFSVEVVERGEVISYIQATGVVESESEVLILSPARSLVKDIMKEPGSWIEKGEVILELDREEVLADIEKISDQLEMRRNTLDKNQLNAQSTRLDLEYNEEVKKLKITSLESTLADQQQLLEVGGISPARIEKTKQEITLAEKDLKTLVEKNNIRLKQLETDEKGLQIQINMQEKELQNRTELLDKLSIEAPSAGIILAVSGQKGDKVDKDRMLVRMSDLSSFKIIGSIDAQFAKQIKTGNRVHVKIDEEILEGRIGNITPVVENEKVQFNVHLKEKSHPKLIANQSVEVKIISKRLNNVVRIKKHPELENGKKHHVFVVDGNMAIKREIVLGAIGNDSCEILSGLNPGEKIIVDGINAYGNLNEIEIKN